MRNLSNKMHTKKKGFTLVETIISIGILSLAVAAAYNSSTQSLRASSLAKEQMIVFYLAQEGMEFIKNIRDENALNSLDEVTIDWLTSLSAVPSDPCFFGKSCVIDSFFKTITSCPAAHDTCQSLNQDTVTGLYGYTGGWPQTPYKRSIQFQSIAPDEVVGTVTITWDTKGVTNTFQAHETFFKRQ